MNIKFSRSPKPIESRNEWKDESSAWPIANPVITCASVSNAGFPSNFVSEPFLFLKVLQGHKFNSSSDKS